MSVEFWTGRLQVEQAQIEAMTRRADALRAKIAACDVRDYHEADRLTNRWLAVKQNREILIQARESLRDRLGEAGILEQCENRG